MCGRVDECVDYPGPADTAFHDGYCDPPTPLLPSDAALVLLDRKFLGPQLAVDVEHVVDREPVAVVEDPPVVGRQGGVDPDGGGFSPLM